MDPLIGAAGVTGGLNLASGLFRPSVKKQMRAQQAINAQTAELNWQNYQKSANLNYQLGEESADAAYNRQINAFNYEAEYNSAKNQVSRLEEAGLSPGLMYGSGGAGGSANMSSGAQGGGAAGGSAMGTQNISVAPMYANQIESLNVMAQTLANTAGAITQAKLAEKQGQGIDAEIEYKGAQTINVRQSTKKIKAEIDAVKAQTKLTDKQTEYISKNYEIALENMKTGKGQLAEANRHNVALETQQQNELLETCRHNEEIEAIAMINAITGKKVGESQSGMYDAETEKKMAEKASVDWERLKDQQGGTIIPLEMSVAAAAEFGFEFAKFGISAEAAANLNTKVTILRRVDPETGEVSMYPLWMGNVDKIEGKINGIDRAAEVLGNKTEEVIATSLTPKKRDIKDHRIFKR